MSLTEKLIRVQNGKSGNQVFRAVVKGLEKVSSRDKYMKNMASFNLVIYSMIVNLMKQPHVS